MTLLTGWCMAPLSDRHQHSACVREYGTSAGPVTCPCICHGMEK